MATEHDLLTIRHFHAVKGVLGEELTVAFELLTTHLSYIHDTGVSLGSAARARAELREARRILLQIKHPDSGISIRKEEMAWAIDKIVSACDTIPLHPVILVMRRVEELLGIEDDVHEIPRDLDKKIGNAVQVLLRSRVSADPVAAAG